MSDRREHSSKETAESGRAGGPQEPALPPLGSEPLRPDEHLAMLIDLMRPTGPELARRWLAALSMVPRQDRAQVVEAVEKQILAEYPPRPL